MEDNGIKTHFPRSLKSRRRNTTARRKTKKAVAKIKARVATNQQEEPENSFASETSCTNSNEMIVANEVPNPADEEKNNSPA